MAQRRIRTAVIPVAGVGTRMLPATKAVRKEMLPVAGKPLIQYAVEEAAASGIETVVFVTARDAGPLLEHFARNLQLENLLEERGKIEVAEHLRALSSLVRICCVEQSAPLGLGHAVYRAHELVGSEPFALLLPDVIIRAGRPCLAQLIEGYSRCDGSLVATHHLQPSELQRHGVVEPKEAIDSAVEALFRIVGLVEKPSAEEAPSHFGISGRYLLEPHVFEYLERLVPSSNGEVQLTDALNLMARDKPVFGFQFVGDHFDAGDPLGFLDANVALSLDDPELAPGLREILRNHLLRGLRERSWLNESKARS